MYIQVTLAKLHKNTEMQKKKTKLDTFTDEDKLEKKTNYKMNTCRTCKC